MFSSRFNLTVLFKSSEKETEEISFSSSFTYKVKLSKEFSIEDSSMFRFRNKLIDFSSSLAFPLNALKSIELSSPILSNSTLLTFKGTSSLK